MTSYFIHSPLKYTLVKLYSVSQLKQIMFQYSNIPVYKEYFTNFIRTYRYWWYLNCIVQCTIYRSGRLITLLLLLEYKYTILILGMDLYKSLAVKILYLTMSSDAVRHATT